MSNNVERQIDIKKYFVHLLKFWWLAVLLAILCGAALGGLKFMKDKQEHDKLATNVNTSVEVEDIEKRIEETRAKLDVVERQNVDLAVEYYRLMQQYNKYKNASVYLSQNPYKVSKTTLYYRIELDEVVEGEPEEKQLLVNNIVEAYINYINTGAFSTDIVSETDLDARYIVELVSASKNDMTASIQNYFEVRIINDADFEDMQDEIENCISGYGTRVTDTLAKHSLKLVDVYDSVVVDSSLDNDIQSVQTDIYNASTRLAALKKAFSDEQLMCYNDAIAVLDASENVQADTNSENENTVAVEEALTGVSIQKKYVVIGMILGLVLYCCLILVRFLFTTCVLAESGFQNMFGLRYLGKLTDDGDDAIGMIAMKICLACRKDKIQKLALISSDFSLISEEGIEALSERLKTEGIQVVKLDRAMVDGKSMSELFDIGHCVLMEKTGKTKIAKLADVVELCSDNSIGVYGVVDMI